MAGHYPDANEYALSSDEDYLVEEDGLIVSRSKTTPASKSRTQYAATPPSGSRVSDHMRSLSKYDHRPRNVEFDGSKFVHSPRRSGSERKDKCKSGNSVTFDNSISISEYEVHSAKVGGWSLGASGEAWSDMWWLIALGCFLGLLAGVMYRGGLGGLHLGFFPRGESVLVKGCVSLHYILMCR